MFANTAPHLREQTMHSQSIADMLPVILASRIFATAVLLLSASEMKGLVTRVQQHIELPQQHVRLTAVNRTENLQ
jgi:hypothetical protein